MDLTVSLVQLSIIMISFCAILIPVSLYFRKRADVAQSALTRVANDVSGLADHVKTQNGRIENLEDFRHRITEQPPWQEVLINQGVLTGKLDAAIAFMNRTHWENEMKAGA